MFKQKGLTKTMAGMDVCVGVHSQFVCSANQEKIQLKKFNEQNDIIIGRLLLIAENFYINHTYMQDFMQKIPNNFKQLKALKLYTKTVRYYSFKKYHISQSPSIISKNAVKFQRITPKTPPNSFCTRLCIIFGSCRPFVWQANISISQELSIAINSRCMAWRKFHQQTFALSELHPSPKTYHMTTKLLDGLACLDAGESYTGSVRLWGPGHKHFKVFCILVRNFAKILPKQILPGAFVRSFVFN